MCSLMNHILSCSSTTIRTTNLAARGPELSRLTVDSRMPDRLSEAEGKEFDFSQTSLMESRRSWKTKEQTKEKDVDRER